MKNHILQIIILFLLSSLFLTNCYTVLDLSRDSEEKTEVHDIYVEEPVLYDPILPVGPVPISQPVIIIVETVLPDNDQIVKIRTNPPAEVPHTRNNDGGRQYQDNKNSERKSTRNGR